VPVYSSDDDTTVAMTSQFVNDTYLYGLRYPSDRDDIITWASFNHADRWLIQVLQKLPEGEYTYLQLDYYLSGLLNTYSHLF
jgi:hypothetical protein